MSEKEQKPTFRRATERPRPADANADMAVYFAYHSAKRRMKSEKDRSGGIYENIKRKYRSDG
jgi:hypothetical protein